METKQVIKWIATAGIVVGIAIYFINKNPEIFDSIIQNVMDKVGF